MKCRGRELCSRDAGDENVQVLAVWKLPTPGKGLNQTYIHGKKNTHTQTHIKTH